MAGDLGGIRDWFAYPGFAILIGTLITNAVNQYRQTRQQKLARSDEVNRQYIEYQRLCLEHPHIGATWYEPPKVENSDEYTEVKRALLFDIVTSIFERAYLAVCLDAPADVRRSQWPSWQSFIEYFAARPDYANWWDENVGYSKKRGDSLASPQYDRRFEDYMRKLFARRKNM